MVDFRKRIAIIGAGASGLPAIRHALLHNLEVVCFERGENIGGLWLFKPDKTDESTVIRSTVINTSKEMNAYSDFPPLAEEANYMHNSRMFAYLDSYAEQFGLREHISFDTEVLKACRCGDYDETGLYSVTTQNRKSGKVSTDVFDFVIVAVGLHQSPSWPDEPWLKDSRFKGEIMHAHYYKDHQGFEGKRVVIVGLGNGAGDIAVELSGVAEVNLVSRRGAWCIPRLAECGLPADLFRYTPVQDVFKKWAPKWFLEKRMVRQVTRRFDHSLYGLKPAHNIFSALVMVNDDLPVRIATGRIRLRPAVRDLDDCAVVFDDGTRMEDVDVVIIATGYSFNFNFLEDGNLLPVKDNDVDLYQSVFPIDLKHNSLAFVGCIRAIGGNPIVFEMQARAALAVFTGAGKLPSHIEMRREVEAARARLRKQYFKSSRHTMIVPYQSNMDSLAKLIGCERPTILSLLFFDPLLAAHTLVGPCVGYYYRLRGPFAWPGARAAILGLPPRVAMGIHPSSDWSLFSMQNESVAILVYSAAAMAILIAMFLLTLQRVLAYIL